MAVTEADKSSYPANRAFINLRHQHHNDLRRTEAGFFRAIRFDTIRDGSYLIEAEQAGVGSESHIGLVAREESEPLEIALGARQQAVEKALPEPAKAIEFSDLPDFTIAGVTDWTAVGGHGSDATLRTSEDLARETIHLQTTPKPQPMPSDADSAEIALRAALAAEPGSYLINRDLGEYYLRRFRYKQALPFLQTAFETGAGNAQDEYELAQACRGIGDYAQARKHVRHAISLKESADLEQLAGQLDEKLGDPLAAVRELRRATELNASAENYLSWGSELLLHRAVWQAIEVFETGVKTYPTSIKLKTALGAALFSGSLYEKAAQELCGASDLDQDNAETYSIMGQMEVASPERLPCIEERLARFVQISPERADAKYLYAMTLLRGDRQLDHQRVAVKDLLISAVRLDPHYSDAYLQLGILAYDQRKYSEAIGFFTKVVETNPRQGEAHYRLAAAYDRIGESDRAKQELRIHDEIETMQAKEVEQERRQIKQFFLEAPKQPAAKAQP